MTYFLENSLYNYLPSQAQADSNNRLYNVGWLDGAVPFIVGKTSDLFRTKLRRLCTERVVLKCKGVHTCQLCAKQGKRDVVGNGEIRVADSRQDLTYACPQMIAHYVEAHGYLPPTDFIRAVERLELAEPEPKVRP
jgi:hypothetical protein